MNNKYRIEGAIGWDSSAKDLANFLASSSGDVEITVSSPGGLVGEALEMFNLIRNYPGKVTAILSGYAMSAASYIPMAADEVIAEDNAIMMIHNAQGLAWGDHNLMFKTGNIMKGMSALIGNAYAKFTGKNKEEIAGMMDAETWLFGEEIQDAGFANYTRKSEEEKEGEAVEAEARLAFSSMVARMAGQQSVVYEDLGRVATALGSIGVQSPKNKKEETTMNLKELKEKFPELVDSISKEATAGFDEKLKAAKEEGIQAENARIQAVKSQLVPGHEQLIESLAYDMKTTGPEAAVKVIQAEKQLRGSTMAAIVADAPQIVPVANGDNQQLSPEAKIRAEWDKDAQLRADFNGNFEKYTAFLAENDGIRFKTLKNKGE